MSMTSRNCDDRRHRPVAGQEALSLADGPDRPDGAVRGAAVGVGVQPVRLARPRRRCSFWIGPFLLYVLLPTLDLRFGPDGQNPPDEVMERLENDKYYRYCTYIYIPFQYASVIFGAYLFTASDLSWLGFDGGAELAGQDRSGVVGRGARRRRHQHRARDSGTRRTRWSAGCRRSRWRRRCYGHFYIEHNRGHHVRVATPEDPASARFGETFWEFLPRSVWGSLRSSWQLEAQRMRRLDKSPFNIRNDVLNAWLMSVVFCGVLIAVFGPALIPFMVIQAVFGFTLLETVNYLEHYGLLRQKTASGRYERCTPEHSWNSDHLVTNLFLYHLQRHSDHHANPTRRYQTLRSIDGAPNLPSGYASMIALTYVPAAVAAGDGPPGARALRRRHHPGQPGSPPAREDPREVRSGGVSAYRCPVCDYVYDEAKGAAREGFPAGTPWSDIPDDWCCPDCGVREKVDFEEIGVKQ